MPSIRTLSTSLQAPVDRLLAPATDAASAADRCAEVLAALCRQLANLIGDSGIAALLHRAWRDNAAMFGGAPDVRGPVLGWAERVAHIATLVRSFDVDLAVETAHAVVSAFVATVCTFLGESLTVRVMHDLWPDLMAATKDST
jgi:hypothetical protein